MPLDPLTQLGSIHADAVWPGGSEMKIDQSQMGRLLANAEADFEARVFAYLRERQAPFVEDLPDDVLMRRVRHCLAVGRAHGFTAEAALVGFTTMMFNIGPDFWRQPAFARALKIDLPNDMDRINAVHDNVTDEDWEAAQDAADERAWPDVGGGVA